MDDEVALQSVRSWLAMIDVLDLIDSDTNLRKEVMEHLSETSIALAINGKLNY